MNDVKYSVFLQVALKVIAETGDAYKQLSWFGRNKSKKETKQAA